MQGSHVLFLTTPPASSPLGCHRNRFVDFGKSFTECRRSWLQYKRGCNLKNPTVLNGRNRIPTRAIAQAISIKWFTTPRSKNNVGLATHHLRRVRNDAVFGKRFSGRFCKTVVPPSYRDQLTNPANPADQRIIPLLKINLWTEILFFGLQT